MQTYCTYKNNRQVLTKSMYEVWAEIDENIIERFDKL